MTWILVSCITVTVSCLMADWNRKHQYEPIALNLWRSIIAALLLSPTYFIYSWPTETSFYIASALIGVGSGIAAITGFHLAARFNGRISTLHGAVAMIFTFILWIILDQNSLNTFINNPLKSSIISLLILTSFVSIFYMRTLKNPKDKKGYLLPTLLIGIMSSAITVIGKFTLEPAVNDVLGVKLLILGLVAFICQIILSFSLILYKKLKNKALNINAKKHFKPQLVYLGLLSVIGVVSSWGAIALSPNPAYAKAIMMSTPLLLLMYHKLRNIEDKANPIAGTILAISVILLVLIQ